jgi:hypothetical protein
MCYIVLLMMNIRWSKHVEDKKNCIKTLKLHFVGQHYVILSQCTVQKNTQNRANVGSVGSRTQLSLRCNFSDYVLRNNYMFRAMMAIFRLSWEYLRATVSYIARIM